MKRKHMALLFIVLFGVFVAWKQGLINIPFQIAGCNLATAFISDCQSYTPLVCNYDKCRIKLYDCSHIITAWDDANYIYSSNYFNKGDTITVPSSYTGSYKYVIEKWSCPTITTTTTIGEIRCYWEHTDKYFPVGGWVSKVEDGIPVKYTCQSDGSWKREIMGCEWTLSDGSKLFKNFGDVMTKMEGGYAVAYQCQSDGSWKEISRTPIECESGCFDNMATNCYFNVFGQCICNTEDCTKQGRVCGYEQLTRSYTCQISIFPTTSTSTTTIPEDCAASNKCSRETPTGVKCYAIGETISFCTEGNPDAQIWTCKSDLTWDKKTKAGVCIVRKECLIQTVSGTFDVIKDCESDYGCGFLGAVGEAVASPLIKAISNLLGYNFRSRCEVCSALYIGCKIDECNVQEVICKIDDQWFGWMKCPIGKWLCVVNSQISDFRLHYGEWIFIIFMILIVLIVLVALSTFTNILNPLIEKIMRK